MNYLIFADVSLDIDKSYAKDNDVRYVPMEYVLADDTFNCTEPETNEMMHEYYEKLRNKATTGTSQITPNHYMELFEPLLKEGNDIIYIALSSGLSNTYESALLAAKNLKEDYPAAKLEVIDSLSATGGMGLLVELAVENRKSGMSIEDNAKWLRDNVLNISLWFKVEDLMYLKRGGRVSATAAVLGTALNIKPILTVNRAGKLDTIDKIRGNKQAIKGLIDKFEATADLSVTKTVYISCADCMKDAENLKDQLLALHPDLTVRITMLSPIIGAHTGPDMLSLIHFSKEREA